MYVYQSHGSFPSSWELGFPNRQPSAQSASRATRGFLLCGAPNSRSTTQAPGSYEAQAPFMNMEHL